VDAGWTVAEARARLPELIAAAARGPQRVFRRKRPAAVVVSPEMFDELVAARAENGGGTIADAFAEVRGLGWRLDIPRRRNRTSDFGEGVGDRGKRRVSG